MDTDRAELQRLGEEIAELAANLDAATARLLDRHWAHGGPTTLSNVLSLCRPHHRAVHEEGYRVERQPDGALRFRRPDGQELPDVPPPGAAVPADPSAALRARHATRSATPSWTGERLDVGYAIDVLHPRALRPKDDH